MNRINLLLLGLFIISSFKPTVQFPKDSTNKSTLVVQPAETITDDKAAAKNVTSKSPSSTKGLAQEIASKVSGSAKQKVPITTTPVPPNVRSTSRKDEIASKASGSAKQKVTITTTTVPPKVHSTDRKDEITPKASGSAKQKLPIITTTVPPNVRSTSRKDEIASKASGSAKQKVTITTTTVPPKVHSTDRKDEIASKASGSAKQKVLITTSTVPPTVSSTTRKNDAFQRIRDQILENDADDDEAVQQVRNSRLFNAFHEAIDEQIIDPSFIQTLASVEEPLVITNYTRDTLVIKSIREDANFTFGTNVFAWKTLEHHNKDQHVVVGISNVSIVILYEKLGVFSLQQEVPMETPPSAFEVITVWDSAADVAVSGLVVATEMSLIWYTMREKTNFALTEEWRWPLHKMTTLIKCFRYKDIDMILLVGTHPNRDRTISATLYEYNFEHQQFWLMQKLVLKYPCPKVGLVNVGSEFLVAFPQNNTAMIYALQAGKEYRGRFTLIANLTSERINTVGAFQVGRYAYIAIGGNSPQILRYSGGNFTSQSIPTEALETVESYVEIPTYTYRDDLILLVQHRIAFSTHEVQRLDVLVWNGESFDIRSNIPCYVEQTLMDNEVSCLLDLHRPKGIVGSAIVQREKEILMIVPRHRAHSSLFQIQIGMLSAEHPINQKVQEIHDTVEAFTKILQHQDVVIRQALELIAQAEAVEQPPCDLVENSTLESVYADEVYMHPEVRWPDDTIYIGDVPWTYEDFHVDVPALVREMEYEEAHLLRLEQELKYAVRKHKDSFSLELEQPLRVKGHVEVHGSLVTDDLYVQRLEEETFSTRPARESERTLKELHVKYLDVRHLNFRTVNGEPASELVFNTGNRIELNDKIIFENTVVADDVVLPNVGTVNGIDLSESVVHFGDNERRWRDLKFESLEVLDDVVVHGTVNGEKLELERLHAGNSEPDDVLRVDTLILDGNLNTRYINGVPWEEFIGGMVLKDRPNRLAELRIEGNLILEHPNITVSHLNDLAFPGDFLLSNGPAVSVITGHKRFMNTTYVNTLDVGGTVNGVNLSDLITLHDDQHIPGNVTFTELHVTDWLEVRGNIHGEQLDQLLDNPTLLQAKRIQAACEFGELHVSGSVIVSDSLNGANLDAMLSDVVYDTERTVEIVGQKRFKSVEFHDRVVVESGMINDIKLDDFITRSTEQVLDVRDIKGNISIDRLTLDGLFDGINVTDLDINSIKLYGDQYTEATLIFEIPPGDPRPDIEANELRIVKMLNGKNRYEYLETNQDEMVVTGDVTVKSMNVGTMHLISSVMDGPNKMINDVHLPTFDSLRFSLTRPQEVNAPIYIEQLIVKQAAEVSFVNGKDFRQFRTIEDRIADLKSQLLLGKLQIENLHIGGDLQVNMLNDINFDELLQEVIWLDRPNVLPGTLRFLDPLYVHGNLTVEGLVNQVNFEEFLGDLPLKTDDVLEFYGTQTFINGFHVEGNLDTARINDIGIEELALKNQTVHIRGDVTIHGQLFVNHLLIEDSLNGESIEKLVDRYQYDASRDMHVIKGDLILNSPYIYSLHVQAGINEITNLSAHLASLIRKDQDYNFTAPFTFKDEVIFEQGLRIHTYNGMDISRLQYDIVRINEDAPVELMAEQVVFANPVDIEKLTIEGDMIAPSIVGCNPDRWPETSIMINEDVEIFGKIIFAPGTFQTEHIDAKFINEFPMDEVITLNTDQVLNTTLYVDEMIITQPLEVGGTVNGYYFPYERENTVMTYGTQYIRMPTIFNSIRVRKSLTLPPIVNGKPFDPVVIGPKMVIESPILFHHLVVNNLETRDMISGVDFDRCYHDSLWTAGRDHQVIEGPVCADEVHFKGRIEGNGMINGMNIQDIVREFEAAKQASDIQLREFRTQFRSLCETSQDLIKKSQNRLYFFKYFTQRQVVSMPHPIKSFHFFDHLGYHFLAINSKCETHLYQWDPARKMFAPLPISYTGSVEQWETVVDDDRAILLVTRSSDEDSQCKGFGVRVWLFTGVQLELLWQKNDSCQAISSLTDKHDSFFVLNDNTVTEYSVDGNILEQWDLPLSAEGYRFVPSTVDLGLALSDGRHLVLLSHAKNADEIARNKRNTNDTVEMALFATQAMYDRMHWNYTYDSIRIPINTPVMLTDNIRPGMRVAQPKVKLINGTLIYVDKSKPASVPLSNQTLYDSTPEASTLVKASISREIPLSGILTTENDHFPTNINEDIISFRVGKVNSRQQLVAVSALVDTIIGGNHDTIKIYTDIQIGQLYQILPCQRPSHLVALELRDETILVFLEAHRTIQIYNYRGSQGFVHFGSFRLTAPAVQMTGVTLPQQSAFLCRSHYLAIATEQRELIFLKAKTQGNCGLSVELDCGDAEE